MLIEVILLFIPQLKGNEDNEGVDEEPRGMLVDDRFDNVEGWGKLENDSNNAGTNEGRGREDKNNSKYILKNVGGARRMYKKAGINTAIIPKG